MLFLRRDTLADNPTTTCYLGILQPSHVDTKQPSHTFTLLFLLVVLGLLIPTFPQPSTQGWGMTPSWPMGFHLPRLCLFREGQRVQAGPIRPSLGFLETEGAMLPSPACKL